MQTLREKIKLKKAIIIPLLCGCLLCGCDNSAEFDTTYNENTPSMFVIVENSIESGWRVVYHKQTKVMYAVSIGSYNIGTFTLLVNPDGTPMVWKGK